MPLLSHAFLSTLQSTKCVGMGTGWQPCPILFFDDDQLVVAIPLYLKFYSYGEYVFDWSWAEAYQALGLDYYPKLVAAIPFSPLTSSRLLVAKGYPLEKIKIYMLETLIELMQSNNLSSVHVLFPDNESANALKQVGWLERQGVQFRWENNWFLDFDDFLNQLTQSKRK